MDQLTVVVSFAMESDCCPIVVVTRGGFSTIHVDKVLAVPHEQLFLLWCEKQVSKELDLQLRLDYLANIHAVMEALG